MRFKIILKLGPNSRIMSYIINGKYIALYLLKLQKASPISVDLSINILIIESTMGSPHLTTASDRNGSQINGTC